MPMTLLTGGARSGKSSAALRLASRWGGRVTFVATAEGRDPEMRTRIERHRRERPGTWTTLEEPIDLFGSISHVPIEHLVVIDCLTMWVANLLGAQWAEDRVLEQATAVAKWCRDRPARVIVVTNEVGSGIVPSNDMARSYRDTLGRVNAAWSSHASEVFLLVAGRLVAMHALDEVSIRG